VDKQYYTRYYRFEREHWWFKAREVILKTYIEGNISRLQQQLKILNVGAATGRSTEWLSEVGQVTSLEYDTDCIDFTRDKVSFAIEHGSILELPYPDGQFDCVCAFDVIEHVEDDVLAVKELLRVCKVGGSVLISVPAHMHLWSQHDVINHHHRRYNQNQLITLFQKQSVGHLHFSSYFNTRLYPLVWLARRLGNLKGRIRKPASMQSDFDSFPVGILNKLLFKIMAGERKRLTQKRGFSSGVSILLHWSK
jgi:2-polyprenyl-3-methyl-5-hydroxy-6-metoxy-1,4-benzoquinol methylase